MDLSKATAIEACEQILRVYEGMSVSSESMKEKIIVRGGKCFKVSNLERRMRESDKIRSVKVKGQNWVKYVYIDKEAAC